jgi:competence protein ComEA
LARVIVRLAVAAVVLALGAFALWHPAQRPVLVTAGSLPASPDPALRRPPGGQVRDRGARPRDDALVVYVVGGVRTPGLYRLRSGDRVAKAVALAGGLRASADAAGVNLAQRAQDGDEVYVPVVGETPRARAGERRTRRHASTPPPNGSVDVNRADAAELAAVPGVGRAVAARIVELREREGSFASLDELLDVAGMTQTRLERARPYLREP